MQESDGRAAGLSWGFLQSCGLLETLEFFVDTFAPFLHKPFRAGGWVVDDQAEKERLRETDAESRPRAPRWALELKGRGDSGPKPMGKPGGWEGLSVLQWGLVRTWGQWASEGRVGSGWGRPCREVDGS